MNTLATRRYILTRGIVYGLSFCTFLLNLTGATLTCGITQLSEGRNPAGLQVLAFDSEGSRALFLSNENSSGENGDGNWEIFLMDLAEDRVLQVTRTTGAGWSPEHFAASGDLGRVVFLSRQNQGGASDGALRLYLLDTVQREARRVGPDNTGLSNVSQLLMSRDGSRVAFISDSDLTGQNADRSKELFVLDLGEGTVDQVTQLSRTSHVASVSLSDDGSVIALLKNHFSYSEIEVLRFPGLEPVLIYPGERFGDIFLSGTGEQLVFLQDTGAGPEIFMIAGPSLSHQSLRQLTNFPASSSALIDSLRLSNDGRWIAFESTFNWTRWDGKGARNLFLLEVSTGDYQQVTYSSGFTMGGIKFFLSNNGSRILFSSKSDLALANPTLSQEIFLADCRPAKVRFFSQIGNGVWGDRRIRTELVFSNTGPNASVLIEFFDSSGDPLILPLKNRGTGSIFHFPLLTDSPLILGSTGLGVLGVGYARITTDSSVTATAVFTGSRAASDTVLYEAAVPLTDPLRRFSVVVNTLGTYNTGLALVNTHTLADPGQMEQPATVRFRLYDQSGSPVGYTDVLLGPGNHQAFFVSDLFPRVQNVGEMVGLLTAESDQPLAVISLRQNEDPQRPFPNGVPTLTTFPVSPLEPERP